MPEFSYSKNIHVAVTPTISSGVAYAAEDQVGGIQVISESETNDFGHIKTKTPSLEKAYATLASVHVIDKAKQNQPLTIFFFDQNPTSGVSSSDNAAINITDAELAATCIGHVRVFASHYENLANGSVASVGRGSAVTMRSNTKGGYLYAVVKTTGTPTYTSTSDLVFKYIFEQGK